MKALSTIKKAIRFLFPSGPRYATFIITRRCDRNCPYCNRGQNNNGELPLENWQQIIDRVVNWGASSINICGGEPFLRKDLLKIVTYASQKAFTSITTNGDVLRMGIGVYLISELSKAGLFSLVLTMHDTYDFENQLLALKMVKRWGILPIVTTVATANNISYLPKVMKRAIDAGILFRFSLCQIVGGSLSASNEQLCPSSDQISVFVKEVWQQKKETGLIHNTYKYLEAAKLYPNGWHCAIDKDNWLHVNYDGALGACSEWFTPIKILEIQSLSDPQWIQARNQARQACKGCTNHCFIEQESGLFALVPEIWNRSIGLLKRR